MSPVAVWQVACIVSVISIQFSVESGCIAIKQPLSFHAAILSGPTIFPLLSTPQGDCRGWGGNSECCQQRCLHFSHVYGALLTSL